MPPSLEKFAQELRDYQQDAVSFALSRVAQGETRTLIASPTGTGKGTMELALLRELRLVEGRESLILTPSIDILRGFLERCGATPKELQASENKLAAMGEECGIMTPVRYRNQILKGRPMADVFICDESHHYTDQVETYGLLFTLGPEATWIGFTATPFRGTPKGTLELHAAWGEPWTILDIPEAIALGCCQLPRMRVVPLIDDDQIAVRNGQFIVKEVDKSASSRIIELIQLAREEVKRAPTCLVVPSTDTAQLIEDHSSTSMSGVSCVFVGQHSTAADRAEAYERARKQKAVLVAIQILGEGVDFPWLRTLIDASPTLSPVVWAQRVGRIMRPGDIEPRYLCVCRNLERHAYLMQGAIPATWIGQAQEAFEKPSERAIVRAFGLESLRKFKQIEVPCRSRVRAGMWVVYSVDEKTGVKTEYVALVHPGRVDVITAMRQNIRKPDGTWDWGRFKKCDLPADLVGFQTSPYRNSCTTKQKEWWAQPHGGARQYGLDPDAADKLTARQFYALPMLAQIKEVL